MSPRRPKWPTSEKEHTETMEFGHSHESTTGGIYIIETENYAQKCLIPYSTKCKIETLQGFPVIENKLFIQTKLAFKIDKKFLS